LISLFEPLLEFRDRHSLSGYYCPEMNILPFSAEGREASSPLLIRKNIEANTCLNDQAPLQEGREGKSLLIILWLLEP
jgi:hypothetical protein